MKGAKHTKTLAKIQGRRIFRIRDIRRCFTQIYRDWYGDAMLVPTWMGINMRRTEINENICYRVLVQKLEFIPRATNKH